MKLWLAPHGFHVAPGAPEDADRLAAIHGQGFYRGWPRADFAAYLADPAQTPAYVVRNARGAVAGFAMLRMLLPEEAELLTIAVEPRWRGRGLGRALLSALLDDLRHGPVRRLFLEVDETNLPARALYRRFGFVEISRRQGYYPKADGTAATALVMRADLG